MGQTVSGTDLTAHFFTLIRAGLHESDLSGFPELSSGEWKAILVMARRQTVTGLLYRGLAHLPAGHPVPEGLMYTLIAEIGTIEKQSRKIRDVAGRLTARFREAGLHPVVMKGPAVAEFYAEPLLRECGDLDLYFPEGEFSRVHEVASGIVGPGTVTPAPDGSIHFSYDGVNIDIHDRYFDIHASRLPEVPSGEATLLMLSSHILKHCMGPGIGLRQICDMAMAYKAIPFDPEALRECYGKARLTRWNKLLSSFIQEYLGVESLYDELPSPAPLLNIITDGGNFGHYNSSRGKALGRSAFRRKTDTAARYLRRLPFSIKYAPREIFPSLWELLKGNL